MCLVAQIAETIRPDLTQSYVCSRIASIVKEFPYLDGLGTQSRGDQQKKKPAGSTYAQTQTQQNNGARANTRARNNPPMVPQCEQPPPDTQFLAAQLSQLQELVNEAVPSQCSSNLSVG